MNLLTVSLTIVKRYQFGKLGAVHAPNGFLFFCTSPDSIKTAPYTQGYN